MPGLKGGAGFPGRPGLKGPQGESGMYYSAKDRGQAELIAPSLYCVGGRSMPGVRGESGRDGIPGRPGSR
jgi:hypothetical protein